MHDLLEPEDEAQEILERLARLFARAAREPDFRPEVLPLARKELAALGQLQEEDPSKVPRAVIQKALTRIVEHAAIRLLMEMMGGNILDRLERPFVAA